EPMPLTVDADAPRVAGRARRVHWHDVPDMTFLQRRTPWLERAFLPVIALASGIGFASPWLDESLAPVVWPAASVLVLLARRERPLGAFLLVFLFGFAVHATGFHWVPRVIDDATSLGPMTAILIGGAFYAWGGIELVAFAV